MTCWVNKYIHFVRHTHIISLVIRSYTPSISHQNRYPQEIPEISGSETHFVEMRQEEAEKRKAEAEKVRAEAEVGTVFSVHVEGGGKAQVDCVHTKLRYLDHLF